MTFNTEILDLFSPISLKEMEEVKLMNRIDTKYTFSIDLLPAIIEMIKSDYKVLEIDGKRKSSYKTLYYDTKEFSLYNKHHNGQLNRYKIRHRTYQETGDGFLEVKFKTNKGRTIKSRIETIDTESKLKPKSIQFLAKHIPFNPTTLIPSILIMYDRITLVSKRNEERLTIDINLEFANDDISKKLKGLVVAEVKQAGKKKSTFIEAMKAQKIKEGSISKYCMGIVYTNTSVRKNNFKEKIQQINKITNDNFTTNYK